MKYNASHILKGTLEEVLAILRDRSRDPRVYQNITHLEQKRWEETESEVHCEYFVRGDGDIPKPLRFLCTPRMLCWREIGCWDKRNHVYSYKLRPFHFTSLVHAWGVIRFTAIGNESVRRELEGEMRIDIPLLGKLAARTIVNYQLSNYEKEARHFEKYLKEYRAKNKSRPARLLKNSQPHAP